MAAEQALTRTANFTLSHTKAAIAGFEETKVSTTAVNCWIDCKNESNRVVMQRLPRLAFSLSSWVVKAMIAGVSGTDAVP